LESAGAFFHVSINIKHRKFFSSHLALPLFVNNKFIELQPGGYFVCTGPDLAALCPRLKRPRTCTIIIIKSSSSPMQPCRSGGRARPEYGRVSMSVVAAALRRHGMRTLLYVDDLLIACSSFEEASQAS
jgi:hypothetical protein